MTATTGTDTDWRDTLTTTQVAEEYGIPANTLRAWRKSGGGPSSFPTGFPVGGRVRYLRADIETWFRTQYQNASTY